VDDAFSTVNNYIPLSWQINLLIFEKDTWSRVCVIVYRKRSIIKRTGKQKKKQEGSG